MVASHYKFSILPSSYIQEYCVILRAKFAQPCYVSAVLYCTRVCISTVAVAVVGLAVALKFVFNVLVER